MTVAVALAISLLLISAPAASAAQRDADWRTSAIQAFHERVTDYVALHRLLAASLPPLNSKFDRQSFLLSRASLSAAIRTARPQAEQGTLFTPAATRVFREILADAIFAGDLGTFAPPLDEEGRLLPGVHPRIYDGFPAWATEVLSANLLYRLPTLPEELEYRVVDYDLVIWDVYADLVIDVLPYAIAHPASKTTQGL
jgi:hypothetical protein